MRIIQQIILRCEKGFQWELERRNLFEKCFINCVIKNEKERLSIEKKQIKYSMNDLFQWYLYWIYLCIYFLWIF